MKVLLDHCVDRNLRKRLPAHHVRTAREMGWDQLRNGNLLVAAEAGGFDILLTVDKGFRHQQTLTGRTISVVLMRGRNNKFATLAALVPSFDALVSAIQPGQLYELPPSVPPPPLPPPIP
jgi:predicted nuclease of predicted toxin-antitoxin system